MLLHARELDVDERRDYLERSCGSDEALRRDLERLLAHDHDPISFVAAPFGETRGQEALRAGLAQLLEEVHEAPSSSSTLPSSPPGFRIRRKIGEGGMASVYEAEQKRPYRTVALKLLRSPFVSADSLRRFEQEGEILGRLQHPGIAQIFGLGSMQTEQGPQPYLTMELIRGQPLTDHATRAGLSINARMELIARVAEAVQHAHEHGVIHRDLKPDNILVDDSGQPKVLDFGIAWSNDSDLRLTTWTASGQVLGTLAYMSPEQASGKPLATDSRADVYALGVLMFELLTGELPYDVSSSSFPDAVRTIQEQEPRRLTHLRGGLASELETIVGKALEKDRARRYASAADLAADLRRFLRHEPIRARPPSRLYELGKFVRRHKVVVGAASVTFAALAAGLVVSIIFWLRAAADREQAVAERERLNRLRYNSDVSRTQSALRENRLRAAQGMHDRAPDHLRNWEWNHLDQRWLRELGQFTVPDLALAAYLDEARILAIDGSTRAQIVNALTGELEPVPTPPRGGRALALSADGTKLLAYRDGALEIGDPLGTEPPTVLPGLPGTPRLDPRSSAVSADGRLAAVTTQANTVVVLEIGGGSRVLPVDPSGPVLSVTMSPNCRFLVIRQGLGALIWELTESGGVDGPLRYDAVAFTADGNTRIGESRGRDNDGTEGVYFDDITPLDSGAWSGKTEGFGRAHFDAHHFDACLGAFLSPDERLLALVYGGEDFILELQPSAPGTASGAGRQVRLVGMIQHPGSERIIFSPSGASAMSLGLTDHSLRLWALGGPAGGRVCTGHTGHVYAVAFSPDGTSLASGSWDGTVRLWDPVSGATVAFVPCDDSAVPDVVHGLAFSSEGGRIACDAGGALMVLDTELGRRVGMVASGGGHALASSPDGNWLVDDDSEGRIRFWDARTLEPLSQPPLPDCEGPWSTVVFDKTGGLLAAASTESALVRLWDLRSRTVLASVEGPVGGGYFRFANALHFAPGGDRLVIGWGDARISIHELPSLRRILELVDHGGEVLTVAFSPDPRGSRIASGGRDGLLRLWDAETGDLLLRLEGHRDYIKSLAFHPDGHQIATGSGDGTVRLWDADPVVARWRKRREVDAKQP